MKILGRILGVLVICLILALVVLHATGLDPKDKRPGLWLSGTVVTAPVTDWSFTDKYPVIMIQTSTPYLLPHSVNINCVSYMGQLYLHSTFPPGMPFPDGKAWTSGLARDPHVRVKIGDQLYDRMANAVTDQAELAGLNEAAAKKYPAFQPGKGSITYYFHVHE